MKLRSQTSEISKETTMEKVKWEIKGFDTFGQSEIKSISEEFPLAGGSTLKISLMAMSPKSFCILKYSGQKEGSRKIGKLVLESEGWTESFDYVYGMPMKVELSSLPSQWFRVTVTPHLSVERLGYAAEVPINAAVATASTSNCVIVAETKKTEEQKTTQPTVPAHPVWAIWSPRFCLLMTPRLFFPNKFAGRYLKLQAGRMLSKCPNTSDLTEQISLLLRGLLKIDEAEDCRIVPKSQITLRELFSGNLWIMTAEQRIQRTNSRLDNLTKQICVELCENGWKPVTDLYRSVTSRIEALSSLVSSGALESPEQMVGLVEEWFRVCRELKQIQRALTAPATETAVTPTATSLLRTPAADCGTAAELAPPSADPIEVQRQPLVSPTVEASPLDAGSSTVSALSSADEVENSAPASPAVMESQEDTDSTESWVNISAQPESAPESNQKPESDIFNGVQPPKETLIVRVAKFIIEATPQLLFRTRDQKSVTEAPLKAKLHHLESECEHSDENPILLKDAMLALQNLYNRWRFYKPQAKLLPVMSTLLAVFPSDCWEQTQQNRSQHLRTELNNIRQVTADLDNHIRSCGLRRHVHIGQTMLRRVEDLIGFINYLEDSQNKSVKAQNLILTFASTWLDLCGDMITHGVHLQSLYISQK